MGESEEAWAEQPREPEGIPAGDGAEDEGWQARTVQSSSLEGSCARNCLSGIPW